MNFRLIMLGFLIVIHQRPTPTSVRICAAVTVRSVTRQAIIQYSGHQLCGGSFFGLP